MEVDKKKLNGIVYTPQWIVETILDCLDYKNNICDKKIIDPACGEGAFLSEIVKRFITAAKNSNLTNKEIKENLENNIFGFDIDQEAARKCITALNDVAKNYDIKNIKWRILTGDSLDKAFVGEYFHFFDFVAGNPPYIRIQHLGIERREAIQQNWCLCQKGSTDIFIAFFELGYNLLNETGKLGYITPNTYLKTKAGETLRNFIKINRCLKMLIDFEHNQLFNNATTYSVITILDKTYKQNNFSLFKGDTRRIGYVDLINTADLKGDNWILAKNDIIKKLNIIEKRGLPLNKIAKIHVGVTTLADNYYIFKNPKINGNTTEIFLRDGRQFTIETNILKPIIKASVLKNSNENQNRYIIFPYKKISDKHVIIQENDLKNNFPLTYKYFLAIKDIFNNRDKGKINPVAWYAFGRAQGLDTSFGKKILTSPINLKPNFIVWEKEEYTFYAGYCVKFDGDLKFLAEQLNSADMEFYINHISRDYQNNYKSFAKSFIEKFGVAGFNNKLNYKQLSVF